MSKAAYLQEFEHWLRTGKSGRMPSPCSHGLLTGEVLSELCAIEQGMRAETGLGTWQYYDPVYYGPMMASLRRKHHADSRAAGETPPPEDEDGGIGLA